MQKKFRLCEADFIQIFGHSFREKKPKTPKFYHFFLNLYYLEILSISAFFSPLFQLKTHIEKFWLKYCTIGTISNCSAGHGSRPPLTAPKLVYVTGHISLGQL